MSPHRDNRERSRWAKKVLGHGDGFGYLFLDLLRFRSKASQFFGYGQALISEQMSKYQNIVGPVIREWREKNNLTQDQLATKLNLKGWDLSRTTLSKIEAQVRCVTDLELLSLSQCIGIEPTELLRQAALYQKRKTQAKPSLGHLPSQ